MKLTVSFLAVASAQFKPKPCCVAYTIEDTREIQLDAVNYNGTYHKKSGSKEDGRVYQLESVMESDVYLYWTMEGIKVQLTNTRTVQIENRQLKRENSKLLKP